MLDLWSNLGSTRGILVILAERDTLGALLPKQVAPRHSGYSRGPIGKNDIFKFFGVQPANRGWTKYGINIEEF